jgi:predicted phage-related endonuclease
MNLGLTPEQIAERKLGIGGSDAGRVMAGDWVSLFREKTGRAEPEDLSNVLAVQMGSATENFNAFWYTKQTGRLIAGCGERVQSVRYPWMIANLDGVTETGRGIPAYWDAKHVGRLDEATVLRYTPQMVHCCTILDLDWWVLSVFIGNAKWECVEQEVDPLYQAELIAKEEMFWSYVVRDEEPPPMTPTLAPKPTPKLRTVQLEDEWRADWPNWGGDMVKLFQTFAGTHGAYTAHNICREEIKRLLPEDVGLVTRGLIKVARDKAGAVRMSLSKGKDDDA